MFKREKLYDDHVQIFVVFMFSVVFRDQVFFIDRVCVEKMI